LQERDGVANGNGGPGGRSGCGGGFGKGCAAGAQPAAFDETNHRARFHGENGGTALAKVHRVAEEEDFGGGSGFIELGRLVGEDFAGEAVFARDFESVGVLLLGRVERKSEDRLARGCGFGGKSEEVYFVFRGEGICRGAQDGYVMLGVLGDNGRGDQLGRAIAAADEDVGLAAVAKVFQDMGDREDVSLFIYEEAVAKEAVVIAARGRGLVQLINDRADSGGKRSVVGKIAGRGCNRQAAGDGGEKSGEPGSAIFSGPKHWLREPFQGLTATTVMTVAAAGVDGKARKGTG
jgi:hypothetical protein